MRANYRIEISVGVHDLAELRAYALARCIESGIAEDEFSQGEVDHLADNVEYWLGWAFDAGTPTSCGFQIEDSQVVYEGDHDDNPFHSESPEGRAWAAGDRSAITLTGQRFALLSKQGTACAETVLTASEYTPENRARVERDHCKAADDSPQPGTWTDVSANEACCASSA